MNKIYGWILICTLLIAGCAKNEFMPPAQGEKLPYTDTVTVTVVEALAQSPAKLFYQAWQRSNMKTILAPFMASKGNITILAPSDQAMREGGYTAERIQNMNVQDIDSLLMFYTLRERVSAAALENRTDNYPVYSLLRHPRLRGMPDPEKYNPQRPTDFLTYYFIQHLHLKDGKTYVNGKPIGNGKSIAAKDGYIWLLDRIIPKPEKTIVEVLRADSRFSMLMELLYRRDTLYDRIYMDGSGYPIDNPESAWFPQRLSWEIRKNRWSGQDEEINILPTTTFLPTNDAFKAAGFHSVDDIMAFNVRRGLPYYEDYSMHGLFATDSLLDYHLNWGYLQRSAYGTVRNIANPIFYSNMLLSNVMPGIMMEAYMIEPHAPMPDDRTYFMPLEFRRSPTGSVEIRVKGAAAPPATLVEGDIPTLIGPVHAVDRLLIPKGFKLD